MPQAAPKSNQISNELIDILVSKQSLTEMQFYRYIKDIEKLKDSQSESYLKALANGAYGRRDTAIAFFEEALQQNSDVIAQNYIVYVNDYGSYKQLSELVNRLVKQYRSPRMLGFAWETNLFNGDINKALHFAEKFIRSAEEKEAEKMKDVAATALAETTVFKKISGVTDDDFMDIAQRVITTADSHNVNPMTLRFFSIPEENTSSYVMKVNTSNPDILSDMNLDIAFSLAENDNLIGKKFSVWFEGISEE